MPRAHEGVLALATRVAHHGPMTDDPKRANPLWYVLGLLALGFAAWVVLKYVVEIVGYLILGALIVGAIMLWNRGRRSLDR
jgi:hypothetical protein